MPVSQEVLDRFSSGAQSCIRNLQAHKAVTDIDCGKSKKAAVLVALFETPEKDGLRIVLTTRAMTLRSHPNQTALPGGKMDGTDLDADFTARREAFEEVELPLGPHPHLHKLTELEPFLSKYKIIVFPVVYLISDYAIVQNLIPSPDEVGAIFDVPLEYCLTAVWPGDMSQLSLKGSEDWPYDEDFYARTDTSWLLDGEYEYRMNRLRTTGTPLKGLTSDVLISLAEIAYETPSTIPRFAPRQLAFQDAIHMAVEASKRGDMGGKPIELTRQLSTTPEPVYGRRPVEVPPGPMPAL